jgi:hypothetical protein
MKNSPYLDKPLVPLAVALRSMLADTEVKLATAARRTSPAPREGRGPASMAYAPAITYTVVT